MEKDNLILCIGITYSTMAVVACFFAIPAPFMMGICVAGVCFAMGQILHEFKESKSNDWFRYLDLENKDDPMEMIQMAQNQAITNSFLYKILEFAEVTIYCIGFASLMIVPMFNISIDYSIITNVCSIASLSIIFLSVYFNNKRQREKQEQTEKFLVELFLKKKL